MIIDLDNIDAMIRMFAPDIELNEIKPKPLPPRHAAYKGEVARIVLATLRDAKRPCSTQELVFQFSGPSDHGCSLGTRLV